MTAPRPPLPDDLRRRLDVILAKAALRRFPGLAGAITALVQDAFARQPAPETVAAMARQLALLSDLRTRIPALSDDDSEVQAAAAEQLGEMILVEDEITGHGCAAADIMRQLATACRSETVPLVPEPGLAKRVREFFRGHPLFVPPGWYLECPECGGESGRHDEGCDGIAVPRRREDKTCPDGGTCHHAYTSGCFRVAWAGPLSGVFPDDAWPAEIVTEFGDQDGVL